VWLTNTATAGEIPVYFEILADGGSCSDRLPAAPAEPVAGERRRYKWPTKTAAKRCLGSLLAIEDQATLDATKAIKYQLFRLHEGQRGTYLGSIGVSLSPNSAAPTDDTPVINRSCKQSPWDLTGSLVQDGISQETAYVVGDD
jgi:hypothetical protein